MFDSICEELYTLSYIEELDWEGTIRLSSLDSV